eukprot:m.237852 g.237852  ORF g.237852 m.237852 type:complete len:131 (-) comp13206_c0_seq1:230-622(-)
MRSLHFPTMDDSPWADEDDADRSIAARDARRIQSTHATAAFREAVGAAQESVLQDSFGAGFIEGMQRGRAWGEVHGLASAFAEIFAARGLAAQAAAARAIMEEAAARPPDADPSTCIGLRERLDALMQAA